MTSDAQLQALGRVAQLALDWARIMADTRPVWDNIGPDFVARAGGGEAPEPAAPVDRLRQWKT